MDISLLQRGITEGNSPKDRKPIQDMKTMLEEALTEVYGRERWQYYSDHEDLGESYIIYFPETLITTGSRKHIIKDLYFSFGVYTNFLEPEFRVLGPYKGLRATLSDSEARSNYSHSHLSGAASDFKWSGFCLGSGPLTYYEPKYPNYDSYIYWLNLINTYLEWESTAGVPYRRISKVGKLRPSRTKYQYISNHSIATFMEHAEITYNKGIISVKRTKELEKKLLEEYPSTGSVKIDGQYYQLSGTNNRYEFEPKTLFKFKGKEIKSKIYEEYDKKPDYDTFSEEQWKVFEIQFQRFLTEKGISYIRAIQENSNEDNSEVTEEDTVSVQAS